MGTDSGPRNDTLTVVLADPIDVSHAPVPTNDSEQLLFRNLFESLVRIDCEGEVRPQLALGWSADSARRIWTFTLRGDSPYGDASEAAALIAQGWKDRWPAVAAIGIENAVIQADGRLSVTMRESLDSVPRLFAHPATAVSYNTDSTPWLVSGAGIRGRHAPPALIDFSVELADPRDAFDRGGDFMVTRDPDLLDYVAKRPEFDTYPLPWNRTYVLLWPAIADSAPGRQVRDAVRAEARPAQPPFWWDRLATCAERSLPQSKPQSSRVVYVQGDDVARGLAERIVALARAGAGLRTAALEPAQLAASLAGGLDRAYVLALPRQTLTPCQDASRWPSGATIQPLIDTRAYAIVRKGSPPLTVDWDGIIRVAEP